MKKLLFITTWDFSDGPSVGITKKIRAQIKAFENNGFDTAYTYISNNIFYVCENNQPMVLGKVGKLRKLVANYYLYQYINNKKYPFVYSRYGLADLFYFKALKQLHRNGSINIIEIPTYPYDAERPKGILWWGLYMLDKIYRRRLKASTDYIATYSEHTSIFNIPAIPIINGIDFDTITVRHSKNDTGEIHLIAVAALAKWHGYDRLIQGLMNYYTNLDSKQEKRKIVFHIVGDGPVRVEYEQMVKDYNIQEYVIFHGMLYGSDLDEVYDLCDIGVENLGFHRCGVYRSSTLKSREYAAKGLPFVTSCTVDIFDGMEFVLKVPSTNEWINCDDIVKFYDMMYNKTDKNHVSQYIRETAKDRCSMNKVIAPVIEKFKV